MRGVSRSLAWSDFFAWSSQAPEQTAHGGDTDAHAYRIGYPGAQLRSREIGVVIHPLPHQCGGGRIQAQPLAASVGFGRHVPGRAVTASELFDEREAHAEEVRKGALRAKPTLARTKNLWS